MTRRLIAFAAVLAVASAQAQPLDAPPPLPAGAGPAAQTKSEPAARTGEARTVILEDEALADLPPARQVAPEARIEQRRQGNRIVEITVTPAGSTRSYTIVSREGQRPLSVQDLGAGLSTPRFFKLDF
jgi:hypothetical protein